MIVMVTDKSHAQLTEVAFADASYQFVDMHEYDDGLASARPEYVEARDMFLLSIESEDYGVYRGMFVEGECFIPLEDFVNWRAQMEGVDVRVTAIYEVKSVKETYYFIAYDYINDLGLFRLGVGMKSTPTGIKFLSLDEGLSMQEPKIFFSRVSPDVMKAFAEEPESSDNPLNLAYSKRGSAELDADLVLDMEQRKYYDPAARDAAEPVFLPYFENINNNAEVQKRINDLSAYVDQLNLTTEEKEGLKQMIEDYRIARAILEIRDKAGVSEEEVYDIIIDKKTGDK